MHRLEEEAHVGHVGPAVTAIAHPPKVWMIFVDGFVEARGFDASGVVVVILDRAKERDTPMRGRSPLDGSGLGLVR